MQRKPTYPVTGNVLVDGQPAADLMVTLHPAAGVDPEVPTYSSTVTDANGDFAVSTYDSGDGAPEGEYALTFTWGQLNAMSRQYEGDKLGGKYANPAASTHKVQVRKGEPADLGRIELTTK